MPFQFSLTTVLRVRSIIEEREERMLQRILFEIATTVEAIARSHSGIAGWDASRRTDVFKACFGTNIHASYGEVEELKLSIKELEEKLEKLEQLRDKQLAVYRTARMNREMISDMYVKTRDIYNLDLARREQKALDDNYVSRKVRI